MMGSRARLALALVLVFGFGCPHLKTPCGPANCPGCCDSTDTCQSGATLATCGISGGVCKACSTGQACQSGSCVQSSCTPSTCSGCCTDTGSCVTGSGSGNNGSCGNGGNACVSCLGTQVCDGTGHCGAPGNDAGTDLDAAPGTDAGSVGADAGPDAGLLPDGGCSCAPPYPYCSPSGSCVQCTSQAQCVGTTPYCSPAGQCVACLSDLQCTGGFFSHCDATGQCVQCVDDTQCSGSYPHCETRSLNLNYGYCVACVAASQCPSGQVCQDATDSCQADCRKDAGAADCAAGLTVCDPASGQCVGCLSNQDCLGFWGSSYPLCDLRNDNCVQCISPSDCSYSYPGCSRGYCGSCGRQSDCPAGLTCSPNSQCVCTGPGQCGGVAPACEITSGGYGYCGCGSTSDCSGGLVCNSVSPPGVCQTSCTVDAGNICAPAFGSFCNASTGLCGSCTSDNECASVAFGDGGTGQPYCLTDAGYCVGCTSNSQCSGSTPYCSSNTCVQCVSPSQCPLPYPGCNSFYGICGSCTYQTDCPSGFSCDSVGLCRAPCSTVGATCPSWQPFCHVDPTVDGGWCLQCVGDAGCPAGQTCDPNYSYCH